MEHTEEGKDLVQIDTRVRAESLNLKPETTPSKMKREGQTGLGASTRDTNVKTEE
jgi:hypothetical protein